VSFVEPAPEVQQLAALAAEGEVRQIGDLAVLKNLAALAAGDYGHVLLPIAECRLPNDK
jgi:ubiquinone biosynthesis protein UbiJ